MLTSKVLAQPIEADGLGWLPIWKSSKETFLGRFMADDLYHSSKLPYWISPEQATIIVILSLLEIVASSPCANVLRDHQLSREKDMVITANQLLSA
jgi:hypothetical protein